MARIGIRLNYQRTDAAFMTFRLCTLFNDLGFEVEILPFSSRPGTLGSPWDRVVVRDPKTNTEEWVQSMSHVIHLGNTGGVAEMEAYAKDANKCKTKLIFLCLWHQLKKDETDTLGCYDHIVCPSQKAAAIIKERADLENVHWIPWDPGLPVTTPVRDIDPKRLGVFWDLDGSQLHNQDMGIVRQIEKVIRKHTNVWLTVVYNDKIEQQHIKELRRLVQIGDGRVELIKSPSREKHALLLSHHDLTLWPTVIESVPLVGLTSLFMGTPVLAFDHPVVGELVKDGKNGELVACSLTESWLGVPQVIPDYAQYQKQLEALLKDVPRLAKMREWTSFGLKDIQAQFKSRWIKLLEL